MGWVQKNQDKFRAHPLYNFFPTISLVEYSIV